MTNNKDHLRNSMSKCSARFKIDAELAGFRYAGPSMRFARAVRNPCALVRPSAISVGMFRSLLTAIDFSFVVQCLLQGVGYFDAEK